MRAEDIEQLVSLGTPTLSPDGAVAVVAAWHPSLLADANVGQLWEFRLAGGSRRLTRGRNDRAPRFSPDGSAIAFLRQVDGVAQLHLVPADGGEPMALTEQRLGVTEFAWSPDSRRIVFAAPVPEHGRYGTVEGLGPTAEPPRRITRPDFRANGVGYTLDRPTQLFVLEVPPLDAEPSYERAPSADDPADGPRPAGPARVPEPRRLTDDRRGWRSPAFVDAGTVAAISSPEGCDDLRDELCSFATDGSGSATLAGDSEPISIDGFVADAEGRIWFIATELGADGLDFVRQNALFLRARDGRVHRLTDPTEHDLGGLALESADSVLVTELRRGAAPLLRVHDDGAVETVIVGSTDGGVGGIVDVVGAVAAVGTVLASVTTPVSAGELVAVTGAGLVRLSDFGTGVRALGLVASVEEEHSSRDGSPVHGWVAVPAGAGPHPVLLMIHGGPAAQYGPHLFDEVQVLTGAGYAVVYCNPRGSAGYGEEHRRAILGRMGTVDLDDVLAFLDGALAAHPELDGDRVGILGGSYGGYLTAWTIAHDHRWRAAVVERGFLDPEYFIGTSDIGWFFSEQYTGADAAQREEQSPQAVVHRVTTPTLVLHSEEDLRCPLPQAERYWLTLRRQGVETELLVFPGENHELSRSGRPSHRVQRFAAVLDWFQRYMPATA